MVKVFPFKGIIYNKNITKDMTRLMTPPYDVISKEDQEKYYATHHYNVIRLILGKEFPGDSDINNKYIRAAKFFESWLKHHVLLEDEEQCIYIYEQRYSYKKQKYIRRGFIALLRLEDLGHGKVFPHEGTLSKPKADRLELIRTCSANLEPIFAIYSDKREKLDKIMKKFTKRKPIIDITDINKIKHRIWKIDKKGAINKIVREMTDKAVFIADGHHRYEAALKFRDEMKDRYQRFTGEELYNHIMIYFTHIESKGLTILPIHRLIHNIPELDIGNLEEAIKKFFDVEEISFNRRTEKRQRKKFFKKLEKEGKLKSVFGLYLREQNKYYLLTLKNEKIMDKLLKDDKPKEWRKLDVVIIHTVLINHILGISEEGIAKEDNITYTKDENEAIELVKKGTYQMAIVLNPTKVEQIVNIASEKELMPQKSTYFYPKLLTGLVMNKIYLDEKVSN